MCQLLKEGAAKVAVLDLRRPAAEWMQAVNDQVLPPPPKPRVRVAVVDVPCACMLAKWKERVV